MKWYDYAILFLFGFILVIQTGLLVESVVYERQKRGNLYRSVGEVFESAADWIDNSYEKPKPNLQYASDILHIHAAGQICYTCLASEIACMQECCAGESNKENGP